MAVSTRQALLQALSAAGGSYVSGQQLAETLGVSRAAVHKAAAALTAQGYALEAAPRRGYRLATGTGAGLAAGFAPGAAAFAGAGSAETLMPPAMVLDCGQSGSA